jgi:hypothetical protein
MYICKKEEEKQINERNSIFYKKHTFNVVEQQNETRY